MSGRTSRDSTCNQINFKAVRYGTSDWINLAREKIQWWAIVYKEIDVRV